MPCFEQLKFIKNVLICWVHIDMLLIAKAEVYRFHKNALKLGCSCFTNRMQRVRIASTRGSAKQISAGIPQSSFLGPLLFKNFIDDLFLTEMESEI